MELPPSLEELLVGQARQRAKAQILALVAGMEAEQIPIRAICQAMASGLLDICMAEYDKWDEHRLWAKSFLGELEAEVCHTIQDIENIEIKLRQIHESKRNGGKGTYLQ